MRKQPPLLPVEVVRRMLHVARTNGTSVLVIAGLVTLVCAAGGDRFSTFIGLAICGAGAIELHGTVLLAGGLRRGFRWLLFSQVLMLFMVLGYVYFRESNVNLSLLDDLFPAALWDRMAEQEHVNVNDLKLATYQGSYLLLALGTLIYQGLLIFYYARRAPAVAAALPQE